MKIALGRNVMKSQISLLRQARFCPNVEGLPVATALDRTSNTSSPPRFAFFYHYALLDEEAMRRLDQCLSNRGRQLHMVTCLGDRPRPRLLTSGLRWQDTHQHNFFTHLVGLSTTF